MFFLLEFINCYAVVYYSNFLFFYMKDRFGFGGLENLALAALNGLVYAVAAWQGGQFAQRFGCVRSLYIGFGGCAATMAAGLFVHSAAGQVVIFGVWSAVVCFIWPALEAIVSDTAGKRLSDMVGIYNVTWAGTSSIAYFTAGILLGRFGMQSLFWLPLLLHLLQLGLLPFIVRSVKKQAGLAPVPAPAGKDAAPPQDAERFMHLAWIANPLSYVAINTILPLIPSIAEHLGLSTATAGIACSVWMFARLAVFILLWQWTGWHYRFIWLAGAFILMAAAFAIMLRPDTVTMLLLAEVIFGATAGLIYYSSLYYSMNASDRKSANGGLHEAMIGAGLFLGPTCGAASLLLFPGSANNSTLAVSSVLALGFAAMLRLGIVRRKT
jgi:MFS family permease